MSTNLVSWPTDLSAWVVDPVWTPHEVAFVGARYDDESSAPPPPPPRCPHCARDWHDAALTQRVAGMLAQHRFDPGYRVTDDDSGIVCVGSSSCGPNPNPRGLYQFITTSWSWLPPSAPVSFFAAPPSPPPCGDPVIGFGPEHWPVGHDPDAIIPWAQATDLIATVAAEAWQTPLAVPVSSGPSVAVLAAVFDAAHNPKKFPPKKGFPA